MPCSCGDGDSGHGYGHGNGAFVLAPPRPRHIPSLPLLAPHFCYDEHDNAGGYDYGYADESAHAAADAYEQHTRGGNGHGVL